MGKAMKAAGKPLSKGGLADAIATETELKKKECMKVLDSLAAVATAQVKSAGKVTIPGLCMVKTRGLRQGGLRQGQAGQDGREGLLRRSPQEEHLSRSFDVSLSRRQIAWRRVGDPLSLHVSRA